MLRQFRSAARHAAEEDQWLLHKDGFELALQKAGLKGFTHEQAEKLFAAFDKDQSGSVDFREFVSGAYHSLHCSEPTPKKFESTFFPTKVTNISKHISFYIYFFTFEFAIDHPHGKVDFQSSTHIVGVPSGCAVYIQNNVCTRDINLQTPRLICTVAVPGRQ